MRSCYFSGLSGCLWRNKQRLVSSSHTIMDQRCHCSLVLFEHAHLFKMQKIHLNKLLLVIKVNKCRDLWKCSLTAKASQGALSGSALCWKAAECHPATERPYCSGNLVHWEKDGITPRQPWMHKSDSGPLIQDYLNQMKVTHRVTPGAVSSWHWHTYLTHTYIYILFNSKSK